MDKIEKIKKWVQKQMELYWEKLPDADDEHPTEIQLRDLGQYMAYESMESFLDTLSEEPDNEDLNDEIKKYIEEYGYERGADKLLIAIVARHFAQWGAEHLRDTTKMIDKSLEEEVKNYFQGYWPGTETVEQCNTDLHFTPPAIIRLARHFAEWQKSQMLKDAVEGEVYKFGEVAYVKERNNAELTKYLSQFNNGDKVRIVVLKEEE